MRPSILLLDEPTANLDPKGAKEVSRACHEVLKEDPATVILVEHRADDWLDILSRVVILGRDPDGMVKVAADGSPDEIFSDPSIDFDSLGIWIPSKFALAKLQRKRLEDQIRAKFQSDFDPDFEALENQDLTDKGSGKNLIAPSVKFARKREFERGQVVVQSDGLSIGYSGKSIADNVSFAFESGKISTSLLQRRLSVGYGRAAKLIDKMEEMGYVSAPDGQKPRKLLISKQDYMELLVKKED
jgi:energy-coupling factor transport system ATP-binding protein